VLLVRRPDRGLLGGMMALPTGSWTEQLADDGAPVSAEWSDAGAVSHVFTHFALTLRLACAAPDRRDARASGGRSTGSARRASRPCSPRQPPARWNGAPKPLSRSGRGRDPLAKRVGG
jgi:adenine-specific DNA glycosylase